MFGNLGDKQRSFYLFSNAIKTVVGHNRIRNSGYVRSKYEIIAMIDFFE